MSLCYSNSYNWKLTKTFYDEHKSSIRVPPLDKYRLYREGHNIIKLKTAPTENKEFHILLKRLDLLSNHLSQDHVYILNTYSMIGPLYRKRGDLDKAFFCSEKQAYYNNDANNINKLIALC